MRGEAGPEHFDLLDWWIRRLAASAPQPTEPGNHPSSDSSFDSWPGPPPDFQAEGRTWSINFAPAFGLLPRRASAVFDDAGVSIGDHRIDYADVDEVSVVDVNSFLFKAVNVRIKRSGRRRAVLQFSSRNGALQQASGLLDGMTVGLVNAMVARLVDGEELRLGRLVASSTGLRKKGHSPDQVVPWSAIAVTASDGVLGIAGLVDGESQTLATIQSDGPNALVAPALVHVAGNLQLHDH
jgi:hypothetical protein